MTFNQEPIVFNIYEREEESFDLSAAGNLFDATHCPPIIVPSSPLAHSSTEMFGMSQMQEELPMYNVEKAVNENLSQGASHCPYHQPTPLVQRQDLPRSSERSSLSNSCC